jgi:hypothetical protein
MNMATNKAGTEHPMCIVFPHSPFPILHSLPSHP